MRAASVKAYKNTKKSFQRMNLSSLQAFVVIFLKPFLITAISEL
jgi:hypothetical protein